MYRSYILPLFSGMVSSVTIHNTDPNFLAVIDFISENILSDLDGSQSTLQATTHQPKKTRKDWIQEYLGTDQRNVDKFEFRPDSDHAIHRFKFEGKMIYMTRSKSSEPLPLTGRDVPFTPESLTLSVWGSSTQVLKNLLQASLEASVKSRHGNLLRIYTQSNSNWIVGWELAMVKNLREKDSVILDHNDMDFLLKDAKKFLSGSQWYAQMGIPYRRGYLLYGPPGCGKTSFAQVLASELNLDISILNLTHANLNDNKLAEYLRDAPFNSIIVLEDIDAIFVERNLIKKKQTEDTSNVSFSGLLNAIDGVASQEGRIFFMTTNHIDRLDPALIRPGRCDVKLEVKKASRYQIEKMFLRFFPGEDEMALKFASQLPPYEISMAALQGHFLAGDLSPTECIRRIPDLLQATRPEREMIRTIYEHLERVGLERYSHLFELNGCETVDDLITLDDKCLLQLSDLIEMSIEFAYDLQGQKMMSQLLLSTNKSKNDNNIQNFLNTIYSLVDIATLRDSFLVSYSGSANSSEEEITTLCRRFCEILSHDGKGLISHFQLKTLLKMYPNRPNECLTGASAFLPRKRDPTHIPRTITLYQFLKRAGLARHIHTFHKQGIDSVDDLLSIENEKDIRKFGKKLKGDYKLTLEEGLNLAEILTKTKTNRQSFYNFGLYFKTYILEIFYDYYSNPTTSSTNATIPDEMTERAPPPPPIISISDDELSNIAYEFSTLVTDNKGRALVSIIEILNHLKCYSDPREALKTASDELVSPPYPPAPCPSPVQIKSIEWIEDWFSAYDREHSTELTQYASKFVHEGLCTEADIATHPLFTEDNLEKIGVKKLGHRRTIIRMQEQLIENKKLASIQPSSS